MTDLVYKIILALVLVAAVAVVGYYVGYDLGFEQAAMTATPQPTVAPTDIPSVPQPTDGVVFCTQDAMECPDGSFVGRVPPRCEFAPCAGF